nr:diguanylate cyclase/phosphodiesterase with PAS/PAC sensors [uncultured bacterium]
MGLANTLDWLQLQMLAPHGVCLTWSSPLIWTYVIADSLIALSYFSIPFALFYFLRKRKDIPFSSVFIMFGLFILACGATHVMDVWKLWIPNYWSDAILRQFTAGISVGTAVMLWVLMPKALAIPSTVQIREKNNQLENEIKQRQEAEALFENAFEYAPIGIALVSAEGKFLNVNQSVCQILGYDELELLARSFQDITYPEDLEKDLLLVQEMLARKRDSFAIEKRYIRKDGTIIWAKLSVSATYKPDGGVNYFISQIQDISEQKLLSQKFYESEAQFRAAFDHAPTGVAMVSLKGEFLAVNDALCEIFGYAKDELIALDFQTLTHPDDLDVGRDSLRQLVQGDIDHTSSEKRYLHKSGRTIWALLSTSLVNDAQGKTQVIVSHVVDISLAKEGRTSLENSEAMFKGVFTQSGVGMALLTPEGRWSLANDTLCEMLGYEEKDLLQKTFLEITHPDDISKDKVLFERVQRNQLNAFHLEKRYLKSNGTVIWAMLSVTAVRDSKDRVEYFINQVIDISARKAAEQALAHNEAQLRTILDTIAEGIIVQTRDQQILEFNANVEIMLGLSLEQYIGEAPRDPNWKALNEDGSHTTRRALARQTLATGTPHSGVLEIHKPSGEISWILANANPIHLADQTSDAVVSSFTDITEMRKASQDLKEYATMLEQSNRDLQDFAYVASHDLQEPLRMVSSFVQLLEKRYGQQLDETANSYINFAVDGAKRMQTLINNLLEYSRVDSKGNDLILVSSHEALEKALVNLALRIKESKAEISFEQLPQVRGDIVQLSQVFQNLITNAIKFHHNETPQVHIGVRRGSGVEKGYWRFSVKDNGIGMPEENLERIFTIFQRLHTRDKYEGTGIGLTICRRIIERHQGKIWAESRLGHGTTFHFTLPQVSDESLSNNDREVQLERIGYGIEIG